MTLSPRIALTRGRRLLFKALGWGSLGMAAVGAVLPGIPTVPFVLLASYAFMRSSPEAHAWLLRSRWFGPILRDWEERRAVTRKTKAVAVGLIAVGSLATALSGLPTPVLLTIFALELIGLTLVLRLPIVEPAPATT